MGRVVLTYEMLKRAWDLLESDDLRAYCFEWRGKVYTGPTYEGCLLAAIEDDPVLGPWWRGKTSA